MINNPVAEIIVIGSELLSGYIIDTNSSYVARSLSAIGIEIRFISAVGDDENIIADAIVQGLSRSDVVLTTGGLGPTVDDKTRAAVALATGTSLVFQPDLLEQIKSRFVEWDRNMSKNNIQQAYIPEAALPIENPVGTAPCFIVTHGDSCIVSLPGVPREMIYLLQHDVIPYLADTFPLPRVIKIKVLHTVGLGESVLDSKIDDLLALESPRVGLAAHSGIVDIRITATASNELQADQLIGRVENASCKRLGESIFGADGELLESVVLNKLEALGYTIAVVESGTTGKLAGKLASADAGRGVFHAGVLQNSFVGNGKLDEHLLKMVNECFEAYSTDLSVASMVVRGNAGTKLGLALLKADTGEVTIESRGYGGHGDSAGEWSANLGLNLVRTRL